MSDVIPAQITQLPGRDFQYDNNPSAFEAILGGVGAFMQAQAEKTKAAEQRRSTEMGQAFAAMITHGLVEPGKAPLGRDTFTYGGSPFYYTQPGEERTAALGAEQQANIDYKKAETYKTKQETGQIESNPDTMVPQFIKQITGSQGFAVASMQDSAKAGASAVKSAYAMAQELKAQQAAAKQAAPAKTSAGVKAGNGKTKTSSGANVTPSDTVLISYQGKIYSFKKSNQKGIKATLDAGGKLA